MNETRIRWERNDDGATVTAAWEGFIGKIDEASFWIFEPTDSEPWWILTSSLPGQGQYRVHNDEAEALKQHAGRWLSEFISSLGAVFPDFTSVTRFETIDHTRGLASISLDSTRAVVAYGTSVKLSVQDDGRTLKVFLGIPGEPATEEPQ